MATIEYEEVDTWTELSSLVDNYFTHFNNYIFRGQANSEWKLESTLARALKRQSLDSATSIEHLNLFKENIRGRTTLDLNSCSDDEVWALGQHFGLNTPLLDWTRSPYVALFFSFHGKCESGKRALWAIVDSDIQRISGHSDTVKTVNPLSHYNDRLVSQRGLFLKVPTNIDLEEWIREGKDTGWITMYKITFPDNIRNEALSALNNKNINHLSLFPDLHGSSLYTNYQLEIEPYLESERDKLWESSQK